MIAWSHDIHYYNETGDGFAVEDAARSWNQAGLPVKFVAVSDPDEADLLIKQMPIPAMRHKYCSQDCIGLSNSIGYDVAEKNVVYLGETVNTLELNRLVLHEFGHVLGLMHTQQRCSIMTPSYTCSASRKRLEQPKCRLTSDNIDQLATLYHVTAKVIYCPTMSKTGFTAFNLAKFRRHPRSLLGSLPAFPAGSTLITAASDQLRHHHQLMPRLVRGS